MSGNRSQWLTGSSRATVTQPSAVDSGLVIDLYRKLRSLRTFETASAMAYGRGQIHGTHRSSYGQEAVPVGVCHALRASDLVSPGLRSVGDILARDGDAAMLMAELFGRATGLCGGHAGALQLSDVSHGVLGGFAVMTANVPMAVGMALATRAAGKGDVAVCFMGDRATNQGVFHEAMNAASLQRLPLICVGVNNAPEDASTSLAEHTAAGSMAALAEVHGIRAAIVDGTDVVAVHEAAVEAVARAREDDGPTFLECRCFPLGEPSRAQTDEWLATMQRSGRFEGLLAVKKREIGRSELTPPAEWIEGDPIATLSHRILTHRIASNSQLRDIDDEVAAIVNRAIEYATAGPQPTLAAGVGVFAEQDREAD